MVCPNCKNQFDICNAVVNKITGVWECPDCLVPLNEDDAKESKIKPVIKIEEGKCPKCNSENITYGVLEAVDDQIFYPVFCLYCGWAGKQWYSLTFVEYTTNGEE